MRAISIFQKQWQEEARFRPFQPYAYIDDQGLSLGAGTLLAPMTKDAAGAPVLALDGEEARILATLSLGFRRPIPATALKFIRRASMQWAKGEKVLAHFELAYARLPRFESCDEARHLFYADEFLRVGVSPRALMLAHGLDTSQLELLKTNFNPNQPRVPAGSHGGGRWTSANTQQTQNSDAPSAAHAGSSPPHSEPRTSSPHPSAHDHPYSPKDASDADSEPQALSSGELNFNVATEPSPEIPASPEEELDSASVANESRSALNSETVPIAEPPKTGGRLGSTATRAFNRRIAQELKNQGYIITGGGGSGRAEEYIKGGGPGPKGGTYVDITGRQGDTYVRVQTIDTYADGSPTAREKAAEQRIREKFPDHELRLIPKPKR